MNLVDKINSGNCLVDELENLLVEKCRFEIESYRL